MASLLISQDKGHTSTSPAATTKDECMQPLRHSYTNRTLGDGATVVKCYQGHGAVARFRHERAILRALQGGQVPVPPVLGSKDDCLIMRFMSGIHGQELLEAGRGVGVLRACGTMLWRIHQLDITKIADALPGREVDGQVLVHGDYGPNNVLLDPATLDITAVLDWEWAHAGDPVEDLAWCEWIVRMHHPRLVSLLDVLFDAYGGAILPWQSRQAVMLDRCQSLLDLCHRKEAGGSGETQWAQRLAVTRAWQE
jgi:aminoglycoside phosphotransferase (APT) family kinase protein